MLVMRLVLILAILLQSFGGLLRACPLEDCAAERATMPAGLAGACCPQTNEEAGLPGGHGQCLCSVSVKLSQILADRVATKPSPSTPASFQAVGFESVRGEPAIKKVVPEARPDGTMGPAEWRSRICVRLI